MLMAIVRIKNTLYFFPAHECYNDGNEAPENVQVGLDVFRVGGGRFDLDNDGLLRHYGPLLITTNPFFGLRV